MGPKTWFPLSVISKKQTSNSNGTTEAETVALSHAMRQEAIPIQQLWEMFLGRDMEMKVFEDNEGTVLVVENGYSPALRHILKTQKCSIDLLHTMFHDLNLAKLENVESEKQVADIFTKALTPQAWEHALRLLHVERQTTKITKRA